LENGFVAAEVDVNLGRPKFRIYKPKAAIFGDVLQIRVSGVRRAALETAQAQAAERVADPISRETDVAVEGQDAEGELASRDAVRARGRRARVAHGSQKGEHPPREGGKRGAQKTAAAARRPAPNRNRQRARWAREEAAQQHKRRNCVGCPDFR